MLSHCFQPKTKHDKNVKYTNDPHGPLIQSLIAEGVTHPEVLKVIAKTPRERFVPRYLVDHAYDNCPLPIEYEQTISQPLIVGLMTQALDPQAYHRVLEIGTGSGYQTAILSQLCAHVYTIERIQPLLFKAQQRFKELAFENITSRFDDGMKGWPEEAPFDRILVTAAGDKEPPVPLLDQLEPDGILVIPLNSEDFYHQIVVKFQKQKTGMHREELWGVRFVPLLSDTVSDKEAGLPCKSQKT